MVITFANGKQLPYLQAFETEEHWGGSNRRTLTFSCMTNVIGVDELNALLEDANNTASLQLTNEDLDITNVYDGYTLKLKVGIESVQEKPEDLLTPALYADRLVFKLGKPTYIEAQLARLGL